MNKREHGITGKRVQNWMKDVYEQKERAKQEMQEWRWQWMKAVGLALLIVCVALV